ncbi:MAG: FG-GAP repeat protein, partial [Roseiflexus sp.]|nr:FG-GAP repeat protein [Roseiflexus sp.]
MRQRIMFSARFAVIAVTALIAFFAPVRLALLQSSLTFTQTKLIAADAAQYDYFGLSVALTGDTVIVGAYGKSDLALSAGAAYAFTRSNAAWTQQARLGMSDALAGAYLGAAVATDGAQTAVG